MSPVGDVVSSPGDVDELMDAWEAAWSGRDQSAFEELLAPDFHYEDPLTG